MIEHLSSLKNETALRSSIECWSKHLTVKIFVLVVDMSDCASNDRVNFIRSCVDQCNKSNQEKIFLMLLHYPPSRFLTKKFYPSLFLSGWKHTFLDGLGDSTITLNFKQWIKGACLNENFLYNIQASTDSLLPSAIRLLASCENNCFDNMHFCNTINSFESKIKALNKVLQTDLATSTIGDILLQKLMSLWDEHTFSKILSRTSQSLSTGISQLSLTTCLKSIFQDALGSYLVCSFAQISEWNNLDIILYNSHRNDKVDCLFEKILLLLQDKPI